MRGPVEPPFVSIIIPARDEERHLPRALAALAALRWPAERCEVIVVDNGSRDRTAAIARRAGARVVDAPGVKVGEVRNEGARAARGEVLAFLDADCLVGSEWLHAAVALLADHRVGAVGGRCAAAADGNWVQRAGVVEGAAETREARALATAGLILRRGTFESLGGFDARLGAGEDDDLSRRLRAAGYRLWHAAECAVVHLGYPATLRGVMRRQVWHGRGGARAGGVEPLALLALVFAAGLLLSVTAALSGEGALLAAGLGVTVGAAALPALRKEWRAARFSPLRLGQRAVVYWWFLLGRGGGLLLGYVDRLRRGAARRGGA